MFGYIKAYKPELRVREYELYKGVYCSLCKELGKRFSIFARFTLNYDFVFVSMLSMALEDSCPDIKKGRCAFNPLVKCNYIQNCNDSFSLASNAAVIMLYYKMMDNLRDEGFSKKLLLYPIYPFISHARKRAAKEYGQIDDIVSEYLNYQFSVEENPETSIDRAADPTAKLLERLFGDMSNDEEQRGHLKRFGYCLGRWVYLIDAADDLKKDTKKGSYNPFKKYEPESAEFKEYAQAVLTMSAGEAHKAFEKLEIYKYKEILENIILLGLQNEQNRVLGNIIE